MSEITQGKIHDAAMIAHEANRAYCLTIGDSSHVDWRATPENIRASVISGAEAIAKDPSITPAESHEKWSAYKVAEGWVYGETKDLVAKTHPCLVPYEELPENDRRKDSLFGAIVRVVLGLPPLIDPSLVIAQNITIDGVPRERYEAALDELAGIEAELFRLRAQQTPLDPTTWPVELPNGGRPLVDLPDNASEPAWPGEGAES